MLLRESGQHDRPLLVLWSFLSLPTLYQILGELVAT